MIPVDELRKRWHGVVIPLVTPFKEDLSLDLPALESNLQWLIDKGAHMGNTVFLAAGSGGDFSVMTVNERKQVIKTTCDVADGRVPVIASAQSTDIRDCIELCPFGEDVGLDAVQLSGPYYYDGRPGDAMAWMREVARHTDIGFAVYNNWYTGYDMPLDLMEELLDIPNSVAVKWGSPYAATFVEGVRRFSTRAVVVDNHFMPVLSYPLGVRCHVGLVCNFYPEHSWRVHELFVTGKYVEAIKEWERCMAPFLRLIAPVRAETAAEAVWVRPAMNAVGLNGGRSRLPSRDEAITPEIHEGYRQLLAEFHAGEEHVLKALRQ